MPDSSTVNLIESYWPADRSEDLLDCALGALLRKVAAEVPDRIALVDGVAKPELRRRWTYLDMLGDAERVARALLGRFAPGDRIAILAPNSPEWILLQHGVSLAGMILVPVNPAYGEAELSAIFEGADVAGIFFVRRYRDIDVRSRIDAAIDRIKSAPGLIDLADWPDFLAGGAAHAEFPDVDPSDTVLVQFTSGTTGKPKGASLHHRGIINTSRFVGQRAGFKDGDVWLNAMPLFHIAGSVVTALGTLAARGTFVIAPGFEVALMLELIETERANATLIVPTMIIAMMEHEHFGRFDLSSLKTILTGAAPVPAALVEATRAAFDCDISILFGQTELNGVVCQTRLSDSVDDQCQTLGRALPHAEVRIVDGDTGETAPIGQSGEICVRGYQNMRGYYGMEAATRETIDSDGWLHTGDLGLMDARGYLQIVGRLKDMIIRGGMNIYPREIEDILFDHPDVAQVSVIGISDDRWGEIVAAVIIPTGETIDPGELHSYCREHLSPHKSPEVWFAIREYPLTPSGKIQKFVLQQWATAGRINRIQWEKRKTQV